MKPIIPLSFILQSENYCRFTDKRRLCFTHITLFLGTLAALLVSFFPAASLAQDRSYLEQVLYDQLPCQDIKTTVFGIEVGVTRIAALSVDTVSATLRGDELSLEGIASLTCATSESAFVRGDASATLKLDARIDIITCEVTRNETEINNFGGSFGGILSGIDLNVGDEVENILIERCKALNLSETYDEQAETSVESQ